MYCKLVFSGHPKHYLNQTSQTTKMNRLKKVLWATKKLAQKIHADNSLLLRSGWCLLLVKANFQPRSVLKTDSWL